MGLHVSATESALTHNAFRDRVHRDELDVLRVWCTHLVEHSAHGNELFALLVDVLLVNFVGHDHDVLGVTQPHDGLKVLATHDLTSGVTWVDDNDCTWAEPTCFGHGYQGV